MPRAARRAGCLWCVRRSSAGEGLALTRPDGAPLPAIVLAGGHGAIEGQQWLDATLEPPDVATRARLWRETLGDADLAASLAPGAVLFPNADRARGARRPRPRRRTHRSPRPISPRRAADSRRMRCARSRSRCRAGSDAMRWCCPKRWNASLHLLISRCRRRETIWNGLGPSLAASTTRGVRALFAGESGTGKTMAASYVATALARAAVPLRPRRGDEQVHRRSPRRTSAACSTTPRRPTSCCCSTRPTRCSAAAPTGARPASATPTCSPTILLTRLETHNGIVILTTNSKTRIDPAFWRRLDQVIDFPLPGYAERLRLWKSHLGARAPASRCWNSWPLLRSGRRRRPQRGAVRRRHGASRSADRCGGAGRRPGARIPQARPQAATRPGTGPGPRGERMNAAAVAVKPGATQLNRAPTRDMPKPATATAPAVPRYLRARLVVGGEHDPEEHHAERVAAKVASGQDAHQVLDAGAPHPNTPLDTVHRACSGCTDATHQVRDPGALRRAPADAPSRPANDPTDLVHATLSQPGRPIAPGVRGTLESRMGAPLDHVRVHDGPAAEASAAALGARAYALGSNIVLGPGQSEHDTHLMAHEATHVVQHDRAAGIAMARRDTVGADHRGLPRDACREPLRGEQAAAGQGHNAATNADAARGSKGEDQGAVRRQA